MGSEGALRRELAAAGFGEVVEVDRAADGFMPDHAHPFAARALILAGEITIRAGGRTVSCGAGDVFHLPAGLVHQESCGPAGVRCLIGRKWGPAKEKRGPGAAFFLEPLRFSRDRR